ncbi:MAG: hypothetical protein JJU02_16460 [Cryomorphaceae bacterium]|nr:hypothetical protein [Cryomorphaceae bacterium]
MDYILPKVRFLLVFSLTVLMLFSCSQKSDNVFRIAIEESDLVFEITLPKNLDTLFSWEHNSDFYCGAMQYHRMQNSEYEVAKQEDFLPKNRKTQLRQLTLSHFLHPECESDEPFRIKPYLKNRKMAVLLENPSNTILQIDSIEVAGYRFAMFGYEEMPPRTEHIARRYLVFTSKIEGRTVYFEFSSNIVSDEYFYKNMKSAFKTLRIQRTLE